MRQNFFGYAFEYDGILIFAFGRFGDAQQRFFNTLEIGEGELGINHIYIIGWAYLAFDVNDVLIFKAAHYMGNGIGFTNIGEKLITQAFAFGGACNQPGDIDKFHGGGNNPLWIDDIGNFVLTGIGNRHYASVRFNGAKWKVFCADTGFGECIK